MLSFTFPKRCENSEDSYRTVFHEVNYSLRVKFPQHVKRFEVRMFTFVQGTTMLQEQVRCLCSLAVLVCEPGEVHAATTVEGLSCPGAAWS